MRHVFFHPFFSVWSWRFFKTRHAHTGNSKGGAWRLELWTDSVFWYRTDFFLALPPYMRPEAMAFSRLAWLHQPINPRLCYCVWKINKCADRYWCRTGCVLLFSHTNTTTWTELIHHFLYCHKMFIYKKLITWIIDREWVILNWHLRSFWLDVNLHRLCSYCYSFWWRLLMWYSNCISGTNTFQGT